VIDVLSRIQWDPVYKSEDFIIGYLERFEGIKETPLDLWLKESTEEDFIPQHRIKYFKKTPSEEVLWSRDDRIDKVFRSGLGDGGSDRGAESTLGSFDLIIVPCSIFTIALSSDCQLDRPPRQHC